MDVIDHHITDEKLMRLAADGHFSKGTLAQLLDPEQRQAFADACGEIEKDYTHACQSSDDPCLESGCSIAEGEVCLQPLLRAGMEYRKRCGEAWVRFYSARPRSAA